jgi:hypothetical protein
MADTVQCTNNILLKKGRKSVSDYLVPRVFSDKFVAAIRMLIYAGINFSSS